MPCPAHKSVDYPIVNQRVLDAEGALQELYESLRPTESDREARKALLLSAHEAFLAAEADLGMRLRVKEFGSWVSGLEMQDSDSDLSLEWGGDGYEPPKDVRVGVLAGVLAQLAARGWQIDAFRESARIPVIVATHEPTGSALKADFVVRSDGVWKSQALKILKDLDPLYTSLCMVTKRWFGAEGVNDPVNGSFNTWSIRMLLLFFLQSCGRIPALNQLFPANAVLMPADARRKALTGLRKAVSRRKPPEGGSLGELLYMFFHFCINACRRWKSGLLACPYRGAWIGDRGRHPYRQKAVILDPFNLEDNCSRTVNSEAIVSLRDAATKALHELESGSRLSFLPAIRPVVSTPTSPTASTGGTNENDSGLAECGLAE